MLEIHPFPPFIPKKTKYLILGSFPGRRLSRSSEWYYETQRGQFWPIMRKVYNRPLLNQKEKEKLLSKLGMALSDTIYKLERTKNNNSDSNLKVILYNTKTVEEILDKNFIQKIFFSSRFVENIFRTRFKNIIKKYPSIELVTLPSSSPRYAKLSIEQKVKMFKKLLPNL